MSSHQWRAGTSTWKTTSSPGSVMPWAVIVGVLQAERGDDPEGVPRAVAPPGAAAGVDARAVAVARRTGAPSGSGRRRRARRRAVRERARQRPRARRAHRSAAKDAKIARRRARSCASTALIVAAVAERLHAPPEGSPMGDEVADTTFSRENRQRYRDKVKLCLDVFARMLRGVAVRSGPALDRARDRAQPDRGDRRPGARQHARARADRRRRLPDRARAVQHRDQHPAAQARGSGVLRARGDRPA